MASGKSNTQISKILNAEFNATSYSSPATLYMALWTSPLTKTSDGSTAGETTYTGYTRVAVTANVTNFPSSSVGAAIQNGTAITFPSNGGVTSPAITYFVVLDSGSIGAGNILYWGSISSTTINPLDTPQVDVGNLTIAEV